MRRRTVSCAPSPADLRARNNSATVTGNPFTLTFDGSPTANITHPATPQAAGGRTGGAPECRGKWPKSSCPVRCATRSGLGGYVGWLSRRVASFGDSSGPYREDRARYSNASASSMQAYLQALSTMGPRMMVVRSPDPSVGPWVVEFTDNLAGADVGLFVMVRCFLPSAPRDTMSSQTIQGSTGTPFTVNFQGAYEFVDVPQMSGTNCTVSTPVGGTPDIGVKLVANAEVMDLGEDADGNPIDLIYDVEFVRPRPVVIRRKMRKINPFGIVAPRVGGAVVDLADPEPACFWGGPMTSWGRGSTRNWRRSLGSWSGNYECQLMLKVTCRRSLSSAAVDFFWRHGQPLP